MLPAPRANQMGRLDGSWVVQTRIHSGATWVTVARFKEDGRDRCEAWGHKHGKAFIGRTARAILRAVTHRRGGRVEEGA